MEVYVIGFEEASERRASIKEEMAKTGLEYKFVEPLPVKEIETTTEGWTKGADSLRRTTIKLIEEALLSGKESIWIWEDDAIVNEPTFKAVLGQLDKLKGFDFVHLNYSGGNVFSMDSVGPFRRTLDGVYCCQSYIVSNRIYVEYLKELNKQQPIDQGTKNLHVKRKRSYVVEPAPVSHVPDKYSYIRDKIVNY